MLDVDRFKLLFGPYRSPRCRVGRTWLRCAIRGKVKVIGISDTPILWPVCLSSRRRVPIICGGLLKAIRRESNQAVAHHWGVCTHTVSAWRKVLSVARSNEGTYDLHAAWMPERLDDEARHKLAEALRSPERGAKIAAAQRGKNRPPAVIEKVRRARKGLRHTAAARAKMRASHLERYAKLGRWKPEEDALLGTIPDPALAELLGRHRVTIYKRRVKLGVAAFTRG